MAEYASSQQSAASRTARSALSPRRRSLEGGLEDRDPLGVDRSQGAEEPTAVGQGRTHQPCPIAVGAGTVGDLEQGLPVGRDARLSLGDPQLELEVQGHRGVTGSGLVEQVEGLLEVPDGVGWGQSGQGALTSLTGVPDGFLTVDQPGGMRPVVRELPRPPLGVVPTEVLQCLGDLTVRPSATGRTQLLVQGVLHEGMREAVAPGGLGHLPHERHGDGRVQEIEELVLVPLGDPAQGLEVEVPANDRGRGQDSGGLAGESAHSGGDHLPDAVRQGHPREVLDRPTPCLVSADRAGFEEVAQHLAHVERVAVRLSVDGVSQLQADLGQIVARRRLQVLDHLVVVQATEPHSAHAGLAAECPQRLRQRVGR